MPHKAPRMEWHLGHLDALRGLAVVGVLMVHACGLHHGGYVPGLSAFQQNVGLTGQRGVQMFFIVSAFTLFLSRKNRRNEHAPTRNFFLRRFFRLTPMFYVATVLTVLYFPGHPNPGKMFLSLIYLNGFSPLTIHSGAAGGWSVADEAIFYMTLPLLFRWVTTTRRAFVWLAVSVPVCYGTARLLKHSLPKYEEFFAFTGITVEWAVFLMGIVAFFVWQEFLMDVRDPAQKKTLSAVLLLLCIVLYLGQLPFTDKNLFGTSATCALLLLALSLHPWPLLVNRITILLGRVSYSLYLLHFFVMEQLKGWVEAASWRYAFLQRPLVHVGAVFLGTLCLAGPLAALTWRFIEEPGIALGRRVLGRLENRMQQRAMPPAPTLTGTQSTPDAQF